MTEPVIVSAELIVKKTSHGAAIPTKEITGNVCHQSIEAFTNETIEDLTDDLVLDLTGMAFSKAGIVTEAIRTTPDIRTHVLVHCQGVTGFDNIYRLQKQTHASTFGTDEVVLGLVATNPCVVTLVFTHDTLSLLRTHGIVRT